MMMQGRIMVSAEDEPSEKFQRILYRLTALEISNEHIGTLSSLWNIQCPAQVTYSSIVCGALAACFAISASLCTICWPVLKLSFFQYLLAPEGKSFSDEYCAYQPDFRLISIFRPPVECSFCIGVTDVHRVNNITPSEFEQQYAYSGRPVVIQDAMSNWTAQREFSFRFFQNIYPIGSESLSHVEKKCLFFPYETNFTCLSDVLSMDRKQAMLMEGTEPWYVGWSNCDPVTANKLRQHYSAPYFLPKVSQGSNLDWIFMGSPGYGAEMHIDNVGNPSWQAQVRGQKLWTLEPPPECYGQCARQIEVIVKTGETIVLDTNKWFHSTTVLGSDMSITIGSEYD